MSAVIYYHPEAYTTSGPKLMGRNAAGESFLRGFLTHSKAQEFWAQVQQPAHARHFAETVAAFGRQEPVKAVDKNSLGALAQAGVVYYPGPGIGEHAWQRAAFGHGAWSLCGITHTTSSAGAMDVLAALITAPVQPWDVVICTSTAVKNNVERLLQAQVDYLKDRLGITKLVLPQLPVIPLGIHTQDFAFNEAQKGQARATLGVSADTLVVLFMGRLSFHAKAHPLAMYQALEKAAQATGKEVVLVECGWHANEFIEKAYADAAKLACPSVKVITLDGRKAEDRQTAWAGADVFCSLSDNIQETFGIVPIEAMAAGLPVVVAVEATAQAFVRLFESPERRKQMGEAGRQRARAVYDWAAIIPQYEALWAQLTEIRQAEAPKLNALPHPWPARMDPFHAFAAYPTRTLTEQTVLGLVDGDADTALKRTLAYRQLAMIDFAKVVLPSEAEIGAVLQAAASGPKAALELVAQIPAERQAVVFRSLAWLVKLGVLRVCA